MAIGFSRQPDFSVKSSEKYLDDNKQVKYRSSFIGVGWKNVDGNGNERINVRLTALPITGELVLWDYVPYDPRDQNGQMMTEE
jgi:hypothetical protein